MKIVFSTKFRLFYILLHGITKGNKYMITKTLVDDKMNK